MPEQKDAAKISGKSPNLVCTVRVRSSDQTEAEAGDPHTQSIAMPYHTGRTDFCAARIVLAARSIGRDRRGSKI